MGVELTPNGTYGQNMPMPPRFLRGIMYGLISFMLTRQGGHLLKLTTTGAKTGKEHTVPLGWFADGENAWLIVGSNGGAAKHPAWFYNLARNPDKTWIEIDNRKIPVQPESLKGAAYDKAWNEIAAVAPNYGAYKEKTDRLIPVIRLTPKN